MSVNDQTNTPSSDNDEKTFRELMEQSAPASDGEHPRAPHPAAAPRSKPRKPTGAPPTREDTADEYMRPGLQHREMRRLKQGKFRVADSNRIDLHGLTRDEAYQNFHEFLDDCLSKGTRHALVICGKGIHSPTGKPVLKSAIRGWLVEHNKVLAYCPAQLRDGGGGALYVLLKETRTLPL